jgi:hypothetical protein
LIFFTLSIGFHYCKFRFDFYNDELQTTSDYNDLDWHHWAVTYDSSTQERIIYRDGHEVARDTAGDYYTGSGAFTIGKCLRGAFNGQLDEARLWNDVRSPEEIRENMHCSMDTTVQGLEAYYPLNEGQGNTPADLSPNAFSTQMMDAAGNEWQVSTAPLSSRFGSGKLALALKFNTPEIPVYIARMDNNPNGSLPPEAIESRYWVATCFDQCTFNADMTFTIPEYLRSGDMIDPERFSLYQRNANGTGDWTRVSDAYLVDELLNTVTFQDVSLTGQFMLARFNTPPVAVSGYRLNDFDGLDDYLQVDKPLILSHTDFTIEFWAKRSNISGLHDVISHQTFSGDTGINIGFSNDDMRFTIHDHTLSARIVNNEDWHHYACVFHHETQRMTIFQDGVQLAASVALTGYDESGNLLIGKSANGNYFEGALDDIRFWTVALEQETIQKNRFKPINPFIHPELETYYRFDDLESDTIARDATVNHRDATLVNMTSGRVVSDVWKNRSINPALSRMNAGNALDFKESFEGHYADLPDIFDSSPDAFTIEWWAYADSLSETKPMYIHAISDDNNFHCAATFQGAIQMGTYTGVTLPDNRFETGKWQHLAFTYDGYTGTVYINGILQVSEPMVAPSAWNGLRLGDTDHPFQVMIDELRIWNIARTETQIQNTMYSQAEDITGLSAWYKFDEFSGNRARDYAGNHHAILYNMDTFHCFKPSHVWDTYNQSAQNELIIYAGYDTDMDDTVTIHMISQPEHGELEIHPFDQQMIYLPSENYVGDDAFTFQLSDGRKTTDCTIQIHMNHLPEIQENLSDLSLTAGSSGTQFNITLNDQETSAENLHITASSSMPELLDIQISGSGNTRTITLTPHENTTGKAEITLFVDDGAQRSQQSFNVTVSDAALTSADGLMIFNRTFKKDTGDTVSLSSNNQPVNIVVDQIPAGVTGRWEREWQLTLNDINTNGGNLAFTFDFGDAGYNGNIYDHYVLLKQNAPGQDYTVIATPETPKPSGDQITFVVNADILDNTATYTLGKSRGYLLNFDGISSAVDCGTSIMLDPMKDFTVEAWVRIEEAFGMLPIVSKGMPSDATKGYALYINSWRTEDRRIVFETQNNLLYTDANIIEWGKWYHIAVVVSDKDNGKMYLNGMPVPVNGAVNLSTHVDAPFQIGTIMNNGWFFHGQMDEVRLWSKALSASEIRDRMFMKINTNIPGLTACWGFNEGRGTSFFDSSGNNLTGLWLNDGPISRKPGVLPISGLYSQHRNTTFIVNALTFDGTGFVSSDFETPVNTFTIEAWVKSSDAPSDSKTSYIFDKGHNFRITWNQCRCR